MKILLKLLKISTSQEHKDNKTVSNGELCILNNKHSLSYITNGFKKRFKPLDNILEAHEVFGTRFDELNNLKSSKMSSECDLVTEGTNCNNFLEFEPNDMIRKEYIRLSTKLDNSNSSNINNKNIARINVPDVPKTNTLSYKKHPGLFITELKKILEIRKNQSSQDQLEIVNFNKNIIVDFLSNTEQLKNKKLRIVSSLCTYPHNKEIVSCLYSYLLKKRVASMGNLSLLNILISEIEYNNEVMIYCFLASNTNKILDFIIEYFNEWDVNPIFFYNVGIFMEKYTHDSFRGCFPIPWETSAGSRKYNALSGFIKAYMSLEVHNEMKLPDIFDEINIERHEQNQLGIIALYNLVKEKYNQGRR